MRRWDRMSGRMRCLLECARLQVEVQDRRVEHLDRVLEALDRLLNLIEIEPAVKSHSGRQQHAVGAQSHGQEVFDTFKDRVDS